MKQYSDRAYDVDMHYSGDQTLRRQMTQATAFAQAYQLAQPAAIARTTIPTGPQQPIAAASSGVDTASKKVRLLLWLGIPLVLLLVLGSVLWAYAATRPIDTVGLQSQPAQEVPAIVGDCSTDAAQQSPECAEDEVATKEATVKYICTGDYKLHKADGERLCRKRVAGELLSKAASVRYMCPSGYATAGNYCRGTKTLPVTTIYTCPQGYTRSGTVCTHTSSGAKRSATSQKSCPAGYYISNNSCKKSVTVGKTATYYCPSGYEQQGKTCYTRAADSYKTKKPKEKLQCSNGYELRDNTKLCEERTKEVIDVQIEQE